MVAISSEVHTCLGREPGWLACEIVSGIWLRFWNWACWVVSGKGAVIVVVHEAGWHEGGFRGYGPSQTICEYVLQFYEWLGKEPVSWRIVIGD